MTTLAGNVTESGAVAAKLPDEGPESGPTVAPLIRTKSPDVVDHISPSTGAVGAVPAGTLKPARAVVEEAVASFPVIVPPVVRSGGAPR